MKRRSPGRRGDGERYIAMPPPPGILRVDGGDGTASFAADPRVPFEMRRKAALEMVRWAERAAAGMRAELSDRLSSTNAVAVYCSIVVMERESRHLPVGDVYGYDAMVDYLGGVVTTLPARVVEHGLKRAPTVQDVLDIDQLLRELAVAEAQASMAGLFEDDDRRHADERFLLVQEQQFDRMSGYNQHIRRIAHHIFEPLTRESAQRLGTSPLAVLGIAEAHSRRQERLLGERLGAVARDAAKSGYMSGGSNSSTGEERSAVDGAALLAMGDAIQCDPRSTIEGELGLSSSEAGTILELLSTPLESQNVVTLRSRNRLRRFPVIPLPSGAYVWARPYEFLHEAIDWFDQVLLERKDERLRQRLSAERVRTVETLTTQAFAGVFGQERVHPSVEYQLSSTDWAEADTIIDLANSQIVVEAKGYRLTDQGRSADQARVRTKFKELVAEPLDQSDRARTALLSGAARRDKRTQRTMPYRTPTTVARCVVMLDRVDPFITGPLGAHAGNSADVRDQRDAWMVCLADLLMVTTILRTPAEVFAYLTTRAAQTAAGSPRIFMESDALGAWLKTREGVWPVHEGAVSTLAYSSDAINDYFTRDELHARYPEQIEQPPLPLSGVPDQILDALTRLLACDTELWEPLAAAAGQVEPRKWRPLVRDLQRAHTPPRTRHQRKTQTVAKRGRRISETLTVALGQEDAIEQRSDGLLLTVDLSQVAVKPK